MFPNEIGEGKKKLESMLKGKRKILTSLRLPVEISNTASSTYVLRSGDQAYMIGGKRENVVEQLETLQEIGVEYLVCFFGDKSYEFVASQVTMFAKEVMPSFT